MERMTNKKLLPRTLKTYMMFALIVLLTGAPVFYFITQWLYVNDTNETLILSKKSFIKYSLPSLKENDVKSFNRLSWNIKIIDFEKTITGDVFEYRTYPDTMEDEEETYRVLLSPVRIENKSYTLLVRMNMIESENLVESIAIVFVTLIVILLAGLYIITKMLSQRLWKPFYHSLKQIEAFKIDNNIIPQWQPTDIEEFVRLNGALNTLIERNVAIYEGKKEFIENASHELQTPLATFQAKLDTLMQTPSISAEQALIIDDLLQSVNRLVRLNKNLLLLSKLDAGLFQLTEVISVSKILQKQVQFFREQAKANNIHIVCKIKEEIVVKANSSLVEILISNLLLNAIRHNHNKGNVYIELNEQQLTINNSGRPKPLDTMILFERFSKTNPSKSGSGLGLAIAGKIAGLYKWQISYSWNNNFHCFTVDFRNSIFMLSQVPSLH